METKFNRILSLHPWHGNPDSIDISEMASEVGDCCRHAVIDYRLVGNPHYHELDMAPAPMLSLISRLVR